MKLYAVFKLVYKESSWGDEYVEDKFLAVSEKLDKAIDFVHNKLKPENEDYEDWTDFMVIKELDSEDLDKNETIKRYDTTSGKEVSENEMLHKINWYLGYGDDNNEV